MFKNTANKSKSFELLLLKWVFLPVFIVFLGYALIGNTKNRRSCERVCHQNGYADFRYVSRGSTSFSPCFCLTEEESAMKNRIPKGTPVSIR